MKDFFLYEKAYIEDRGFPVRAFKVTVTDTNEAFHNHWHEQMEIVYFLEGRGVVECNARRIAVRPGEAVFINSNELHYGYATTRPLSYYCIIFDTSLLKGSFEGNLEQKYITPLSQNLIVFRNEVADDPLVRECILTIMEESERKGDGYELFVKSAVYRMLALLFRDHRERILTEAQFKAQSRTLERLNTVLRFIEENYAEEISLDDLARMASLSRYRFSHVFKSLMGRGAREYINGYRIEKAEQLLKNTGMNITEVAMATGFCDANYFSRLFARYKNTSPSALRKG